MGTLSKDITCGKGGLLILYMQFFFPREHWKLSYSSLLIHLDMGLVSVVSRGIAKMSYLEGLWL